MMEKPNGTVSNWTYSESPIIKEKPNQVVTNNLSRQNENLSKPTYAPAPATLVTDDLYNTEKK